MSSIPILQSIVSLGPSADIWFLDIWGVLHNGVRPFASAVRACIAFRKAGGHVILVSNSPRPRAGVITQLNGIGVDLAAYDEVITSGDVSRCLIADVIDRPALHIGPVRDRPLFDGLGITLTDAETAQTILCTGLYDDERETLLDYAEVLQKLRARDVAMICANPDVKAERGGKIIYCAGAIAEAYEQLGGTVSYAGKPHAPIYAAALEIAARLCRAPVEKHRVLAIGDGVATDIRGASNAGIRSVYVASGVNLAKGAELSGAVESLFANEPVKPVAAMTALAW